MDRQTDLRDATRLEKSENPYLFWKVEYQRRNHEYKAFFEEIFEVLDKEPLTSKYIVELLLDKKELNQGLLPREFYGGKKHLIHWHFGDLPHRFSHYNPAGNPVIFVNEYTDDGSLKIEPIENLSSARQLGKIQEQAILKKPHFDFWKSVALEDRDFHRKRRKEGHSLDLEKPSPMDEKYPDWKIKFMMSQEGRIFDAYAYKSDDEVEKVTQPLNRALGLWLWDYIRNYRCAPGDARAACFNFWNHGTERNPLLRKNNELMADATLDRLLRRTSACIYQAKVLTMKES